MGLTGFHGQCLVHEGAQLGEPNIASLMMNVTSQRGFLRDVARSFASLCDRLADQLAIVGSDIPDISAK